MEKSPLQETCCLNVFSVEVCIFGKQKKLVAPRAIDTVLLFDILFWIIHHCTWIWEQKNYAQTSKHATHYTDLILIIKTHSKQNCNRKNRRTKKNWSNKKTAKEFFITHQMSFSVLGSYFWHLKWYSRNS